MGTQQFELADPGPRFVSALIDGILLGIVGGILSGIFGQGLGSALQILIGVGYYWYFWTRNNGQTLGKQAMKLRVIKEDGTPITDQDAIMRYVGYIISSIPLLLGFLWVLFDSNRQGWHDKIAKTYVVKAE